MATTKEKGFALVTPEGGYFTTAEESHLAGSEDNATIFDTLEEASTASMWEGCEFDMSEVRPVPIEREVCVTLGDPIDWPSELIDEWVEEPSDDGRS